MKVASLNDNSKSNVAETSQEVTDSLYKYLFSWAQKNDKLSQVNNSLLVNTGLIKVSKHKSKYTSLIVPFQSEDKKFKPSWNLSGCLSSLHKLTTANYVPDSTKDTMKVFLTKKV